METKRLILALFILISVILANGVFGLESSGEKTKCTKECPGSEESTANKRLLPLLFDYDPWGGFRRNLLRDFHPFGGLTGFGITSDEIEALVDLPRKIALQLRNDGFSAGSSGITKLDKSGFKAILDVKEFKPDEITVKTIDDSIVIEGNHEERKDEHGYIERHFTRKYHLPKGYDPEEVSSTLSSDGILTVMAPAPETSPQNERLVKIQQTGPERNETTNSEEKKA